MAAFDVLPKAAQWKCYSNQDNRYQFTVKNRATGSPIDITDRTYTLDVFSADEVLLHSTSTDLTVDNGGVTGVVIITMPLSVSQAVKWSTARYDMTETIDGVVYARTAGQVSMTKRGLV